MGTLRMDYATALIGAKKCSRNPKTAFIGPLTLANGQLYFAAGQSGIRQHVDIEHAHASKPQNSHRLRF